MLKKQRPSDETRFDVASTHGGQQKGSNEPADSGDNTPSVQQNTDTGPSLSTTNGTHFRYQPVITVGRQQLARLIVVIVVFSVRFYGNKKRKRTIEHHHRHRHTPRFTTCRRVIGVYIYIYT